SRAVAPMAQVAALVTQYEQTKSAFNTLDSIMNLPVERDEKRQYVRRPVFKGNIELKSVSFAYPGADVPSLKSISLSIREGERVAIIGKVGSGKSSLAKLLIGLYQPTEGTIAIDGINSAQIDPADLRRHIAFLTQEPQLMRGSIRDNLCYRNPQVADEQMLKVAAIAGVDQFVGKLPGGYDTQVGEQGLWVSGGQRQAIALGRAILLDEPIIVLDEPTSHMDNSTEQYVKRQLHGYTRDKTLIVITHKTSMLDLVDRLIVVEDGQILLDGPKAETIAAIQKMGK
uniref:ATP-binding cassette domain-containing protein n=1 Tax=Litorivivens sp. TaxID=2020868 RepID=UPI0035614707